MYEQLIVRGQELTATIKQLSTEYHNLKRPLLTDLSLLPRIKEIIEAQTTTTPGRLICYFVPVVALLYSPGCFLGCPMLRGVRGAMAKAMNLGGPTTISHTLTTVSVWLAYNREFRADVDRLFEVVMADLNI